MEVEMLEDDLFFAELSKRISLLITDDDDEADFGPAHFPAALPVPQGFSLGGAHVPQQAASILGAPAYTLYHHGASDGAQAWQQQCGSKGTGVFIPQSLPGSAHANKSKRKWGRSKANAAAAQKTKAQAGGAAAVAAGAPAKRRT